MPLVPYTDLIDTLIPRDNDKRSVELKPRCALAKRFDGHSAVLILASIRI
jgi:hypothetical protein